MGQIKSAPHGHLFIAIMSKNAELQAAALEKLTECFGEIMGQGPLFAVNDFTDYYEPEFGSNLQKQFIIFRNPIGLENAHRIKVWTNELEADFAEQSTGQIRRRINLDPGYLEPSKLVLFSTKNFSHRVYCGDGIFGEVTLIRTWQIQNPALDLSGLLLGRKPEIFMAMRNEIVRLTERVLDKMK
jgi:hypothetical protein